MSREKFARYSVGTLSWSSRIWVVLLFPLSPTITFKIERNVRIVPRSNFSRVVFSRAMYPHRDTIRPMTGCDRYFHRKEIQKSFRALERARGKHPLRFFLPARYTARLSIRAPRNFYYLRAHVERERGSRQFIREPEKISESLFITGIKMGLFLHWDSKRASCVISIRAPRGLHSPLKYVKLNSVRFCIE